MRIFLAILCSLETESKMSVLSKTASEATIKLCSSMQAMETGDEAVILVPRLKVIVNFF
jgi:hypothetical protein